MNEYEIKYWEEWAAMTWSNPTERTKWKGPTGKLLKEYSLAWGEVLFLVYEKCVAVHYVPTNTIYYFRKDERELAWRFACERAEHVRAIARLLGW